MRTTIIDVAIGSTSVIAQHPCVGVDPLSQTGSLTKNGWSPTKADR